MSATIGKDLDTGMTTITFDSTGRMVQFTKGESDDFDLRMLIIKAEGGLAKESIGQKALVALQRLGEAIVKGDPEEIASIWIGDAGKIVSEGIINGMIPIKTEKPNPFHFFHINDDPNLPRYTEALEAAAVHATCVITELLDKMIQDISDAEITSEYTNLMHPVANEINKFDNTGIGCGDTASDEEICRYLEASLSKIFDETDVKAMGGYFWMLIH
jgi:hypothetical protein